MTSQHDIYAVIERNIAGSGQHLFLVFAAAAAPAFAYTIGNARRGLPKLLLVGNDPPQIIALVLNDLGQRIRHDR